MFYSQFILAKKGPLGTIWIAAHLERKLRKNQVTETNIGVSVDSILCPEVPIALRLSGHLLLGVVRIYSRKVNYLFHDCSEALVKIKQAFHSGAVDLPPEAATAPFHSITLPETFDLDDLELLPDREALFLANSSIDHHVTSREQITLQDNIEDTTYLGSQFGLDERFTDGGAARLDFDEDLFTGKTQGRGKGVSVEEEEDIAEPMEEDDKADENNVVTENLPSVAEGADTGLMAADEQIKPPEDANAFDMNVVPAAEDQPPAAGEASEVAAAAAAAAAAETEAAEVTKPALDLEDEDMEIVASDKAIDPKIGNKEAAEVCEIEEPAAAPAATGEEVQASALERNENAVPEDKPEEVFAVAQEQDVTGQDKEALETPQAVQRDNEQAEAIASDPQQRQLDDVPDIEKVRSAAEVPLLEPNVLLEELRDLDSTPAPTLKKDGVIEPATLVADSLKRQGTEDTPSISAMPDFTPPADDDLLASILGRRTPSLVVAPTPPAKRHKPGPKPGPRKRKVPFDDSMVLDGDHMRQQLSDTSSIRRVRKRAPCTEYERWGSEKEALGQQMFDEPLILAPCENIRDIYHTVYNAGDAKQSESDATDVSARHDKYQLEEEDHNREPITLEEDPFDENEIEARYRFDEDLEQFEVVPRAEKVAAAASETVEETETETVQGNSEKADVSEKVDAPPSGNPDVSPEDQTCPPAEGKQPETAAGDDGTEGQTIVAAADDANKDSGGDQNVVDGSDEKPEEATEVDAVPESEAMTEGKDEPVADAADVETVPGTEDHASEEALPVSAQPEDDSAKADNVEEEMAAADDTMPPPETSNITDTDQHLADNTAAEALDFLVDSKDEDAAHGDDADNFDPDYPQEQAQDNSGWSVRTRAVSQYLRVTFETMESTKKQSGGGGGAPKLGLERLLHGKTRRESARMFFETLVLKTKDYISVEQKSPFDSIYISARPKLMKADM